MPSKIQKSINNFFSYHQKKILKELKKDNILISEKNIEKIIKKTSYQVRSKEHPEECPYYSSKTKCHNIKDLNCFLCACPEYDTTIPKGQCKINSKQGFYYKNLKLPAGKIWDCSNCLYPHTKQTVKKYLKENLKILMRIQKEL